MGLAKRAGGNISSTEVGMAMMAESITEPGHSTALLSVKAYVLGNSPLPQGLLAHKTLLLVLWRLCAAQRGAHALLLLGLGRRAQVGRHIKRDGGRLAQRCRGRRVWRVDYARRREGRTGRRGTDANGRVPKARLARRRRECILEGGVLGLGLLL